jgi:hypothetical protein
LLHHHAALALHGEGESDGFDYELKKNHRHRVAARSEIQEAEYRGQWLVYQQVKQLAFISISLPHGVITAFAEGVAPQDAPSAHGAAPEETVPFDGYEGILGTGRGEPAAGRPGW